MRNRCSHSRRPRGSQGSSEDRSASSRGSRTAGERRARSPAACQVMLETPPNRQTDPPARLRPRPAAESTRGRGLLTWPARDKAAQARQPRRSCGAATRARTRLRKRSRRRGRARRARSALAEASVAEALRVPRRHRRNVPPPLLLLPRSLPALLRPTTRRAPWPVPPPVPVPVRAPLPAHATATRRRPRDSPRCCPLAPQATGRRLEAKKKSPQRPRRPAQLAVPPAPLPSLHVSGPSLQS
mmetsp:Transcript_125286/g.359869  ORF Transcript_125286/g.359869 Transcript_125286/m.359869 type:complete len:242 (-) Transcript_125286:1437-2162(-)